MKVLYIHRNPQAGYSINKVFKDLVLEINKHLNEFEEIYLPSQYAQLNSIIKNGLYARNREKKNYINHITGDIHYIGYFLHSSKTIITVHDIMYYYYLKGIKKYIWKWLYIKSLQKATRIIFISEHSRNEVLKVIHLPIEKTVVIPNPISKEFNFFPKKINQSKPIILHIGTLERKNLKRTISALSTINCHLRIIGNINEEIKSLLLVNNIDYSNVYNLSDQEIYKEYINCDFVNFPSTDEGFGMPIIEGQATGRVVITSNITPMLEVAGNGAFFVDPYDISSIRNAYITLLNDMSLCQNLINNGRKNINRYKVEKIAEEYLNIYKSIL